MATEYERINSCNLKWGSPRPPEPVITDGNSTRIPLRDSISGFEHPRTAHVFGLYPEAISKDPHGQVAHYGYGIVLAERFHHQLQYHGGGIRGFNSVLQRYPEMNVVLAVLSNLDSDLMPSWTLADSFAQIWFQTNGSAKD